MAVRALPTDTQIETWLKSPEVTKWVEKKIARRYPGWRNALNELAYKLKEDKNHDWHMINPRYPNTALGVNAMTWTLWVAFKYEGNITLAPDCPYKLQDCFKTEELDFVEV